MKIVQINTVANWGSTGHIAENIGLKIINEGWSSYIAFSFARGKIKSMSKLIPMGSTYDFFKHILMTRIFNKHGLYSTKSTKELIKKISLIRPDIIHLHNIHGYYINMKFLFDYLSTSNIPVVWTLHDCWSFTGHCCHFEAIRCDKWQSLCETCPQLSSYPKSWFSINTSYNYKMKKLIFNSVSNLTLVPVSNWLNDTLKKSFMSDKKSIVINNGIDLNVFRPINLSALRPSKNDMPIVLAITNVWTKSKGFYDILRLSEIITNMQIIIVGVTKEQIKHLPKNILGVERTKNINELVQLYNMATVYINPTYEDTFPTTNLEALACGTPVITYNTGGSTESVDDETGFVVDKGDIIELSNRIHQVCGRKKIYYQNKCRLRAEKYYNKEDRFNEYIELYKHILNN